MSVTISGSGQIVKQVVTATLVGNVATTSTSFVTTGLSATITPTSSTSKILIIHSASGYGSTTGAQATVTLYRNGSNLAGAAGFCNVYSSSGGICGNLSFDYLDSPATTSAVTYTPYFCNQNGSASVQYNTGAATNTCTATITLLEISGS